MENKINFTIVQDTREQTPWDFSYEKTIAQEIGTLKTGDYTIRGLEDKICIERKASVEEIAGNLGKEYLRFEKELERMKAHEHCFIICEFPLQDLVEYPFHRKNAKLQSQTKISGKFLLKKILEIQMDYNVHVIFAGSKFLANKTALSLMKRIYERYR
jgi:ERCC4-type nuclease